MVPSASELGTHIVVSRDEAVFYQIVRIPVNLIRRNESQPRIHFDKKDLEELAESIKDVGQIMAAEVMVINDPNDPEHHFELDDGERRWRAQKMNKSQTMPCIIFPTIKKDEQYIRSVIANMGGVRHIPIEIAFAIRKMKEMESMKALSPGDQTKKIANIFVRSTAWVYQHLALLKLHPKVQEMLNPRSEKSIGFALGVYLANYPEAIQLEVANAAVEDDLTINQARHYANTLARKAGIKREGRARKPNDDYRILESFLHRLERDAERVLTMPGRDFTELFKNRSPKDRTKMLTKVKTCLGQLGELKEFIEKISI